MTKVREDGTPPEETIEATIISSGLCSLSRMAPHLLTEEARAQAAGTACSMLEADLGDPTDLEGEVRIRASAVPYTPPEP